jgi:hypothetical protein
MANVPIFSFMRLHRFLLGLSPLLLVSALHAWDYEGHRIVNQLALASLPKDFPAFVHTVTNEERIAFLAGEPDRWRNAPDLPLKQSGGSWTDHFCDLEYLPEAGINLDTITSFRYDFIVQFAAGRAANPSRFKPVDPARNADHTAEWPGFAPWAITEYFGRLRSGFSYLKVFEELGTPDEIANAQANIVYIMGTMGHYVGDLAQPLHTTKHHNGWVGENPKGYTTWNRLHSWVDGIALRTNTTASGLAPRLKPVEAISLAARPDGRDPMFVAVFDYFRAAHKFVEPLYQLEKAGKLGGQNDQPPSGEARAFFEERFLAGGQMLGAIWLTAYRSATPDTYLRSALVRRQTTAAGK